MALRLAVSFPEGEQQRYLLSPGENVIGTDPVCDVILDHPTISRHHAVLVVVPDGAQVGDLGSSNGTILEGRRVRSPTRVEPGMTLAFGSVAGRLEQVADADVEVARPRKASPSKPKPTESGPAGATVSTHPAQLFALGPLPRLLDTLGQTDPTAWTQELGQALFRLLPCSRLEIRRAEAAAAPWFQAKREAAEGSVVVKRSGSCEVEVAFSDVESSTLLEPLVRVAAHLSRLARGGEVRHGESQRPGPAAWPRPRTVDPRLEEIYRRATRLAPTDLPVLILGESGTGKELLARFLHDASNRSEGPFLAVNCAALPHDLLEAELFGIESGVATGVDARAGKFEQADQGTLFLDEIGDLGLPVQAKLLRALQEAQVYRVGGSSPRPARVRVVAATNQDLESLVEAGEFRLDLYHRIADWVARLPPLRDRLADLPNLAVFFLEQEADRAQRDVRGISRAALSALLDYCWPGNIRELEREVKRAVLLSDDGEIVGLEAFSGAIRQSAAAAPRSLKERLEAAERREIERALAEHSGHVPSAAESLDVPVSTLYRRLKKLELEPT